MFTPHVYATDPRVRRYVVPTRVVCTAGNVQNPEALLEERPCQIPLVRPDHWKLCILKNEPGSAQKASVVVDFGCEMHGSLRLYVWQVSGEKPNRGDVRIRFGESVTEAMTPVAERGSTNDHANRDILLNIGFLSATETNESGFRFACIELEGEDATLELFMTQGVMIELPITPQGSFACSDERVNEIYETSVRTAYLNMQEYLWDGIKRDRLVWCGDIYPAELTILTAFGAHDILKKSLDYQTFAGPRKWMNNLPSYSLWWLLSIDLLYMAGGDLDYLKQYHGFIRELMLFAAENIGPDGAEALPSLFLDWPNSENPVGVHAGQQALMARAFERAAFLLREMDDEETASMCDEKCALLKQVHLPHGGSKQASAMLGMWGLEDVRRMNEEVIAPGGAHGYSTFLGFATLSAKAEAGDMPGALRDMREYWGGMLDLGATSFWEDFNLDWAKNAARIDEITPEGKDDIHADFGAYCYKNLRHSLCHAWASGPAPFLAQYALGVRILEPGCRKLAIRPDLGDLEWAEGDYPTPLGAVHVRHERTAQGIKTTYTAPNGIEVVL